MTRILIKNLLYSIFLFLIVLPVKAQVTMDPVFATQNDSVVIYYNAAQGNGALASVNTIYAHTGLITNKSASPTSWRHVQGNWGTADSRVLMTNLGNQIFRISFNIKTFYNLPADEKIISLALVFRNQSGSIVGRAADGSDFFVPIFDTGFVGKFTSPSSDFTILEQGQIFNIAAKTNDLADLSIEINGVQVVAETNKTDINYNVNTNIGGEFEAIFKADKQGLMVYDTIRWLVRSNPVKQDPPYTNLKQGINRFGDTLAVFYYLLPYKNYVYLVGDFNNWEPQEDYYLNKSLNDSFFWIELRGLDPDKDYRYQLMVDAPSKVFPDPYAEMILDPWNDGFIGNAYPNLLAYPSNKTSGLVSVFRIKKEEFNWDNSINYTPPAKENLVIYELLVRDFLNAHSYNSIADSIEYFKRLGINAIQLMPIMEFEGNISWGYNVSFFMAADKYYGSVNALKNLIEVCHKNGIAVILDIAMNHSFGQNSQVQWYFNPSAGQFGQPTAQSPWFNEVAKHDFNVGYDYNHESKATAEFVKMVYQHWIKEFKIDGYRLDLSKGYTQKNTLGNIGAWNSYDADRVRILKQIAEWVWEENPDAYMILEHLGDNPEEKELADWGFMLWGNMNHAYTEAAMGFTADLFWGSYKARNWNNPHLVTYMESHDEERMVFKNKNFGNTNGAYNVKNPITALKRAEAASVVFFTIPGPKMIWQFGELGYDFSINRCENGTINNDCRTAPKPIRWDYQNDTSRMQLFDVYASLIRLKRLYPETFNSNDFTTSLATSIKSVVLRSNTMNAVAVSNMGMASATYTVNLPSNGKWYGFFSGDSFEYNGGGFNYPLNAGEYEIFTSERIPNHKEISSKPLSVINHPARKKELLLYPNPSKGKFTIEGIEESKNVKVSIYDQAGRLIKVINQNHVKNSVEINTDLAIGVYLIQIELDDQVQIKKLIINP